MISFIAVNRFPEERGMTFSIMAKCQSYVEVSEGVELIAPKRKQLKELKSIDLWDYYSLPRKLFPFIQLPCLDLEIPHLKYFLLNWTFAISALIYLWKNKRTKIQFYNSNRELLMVLKVCAIFYKPKVIVEIHGAPADKYNKFLERISLGRSDILAPINNQLRNLYQDLGFNASKMLVSPGGVRVEDFKTKVPKEKLREKLKLPKNKTVIGYAGKFVSMDEERGIPDLIKSFKILHNKFPDTILICIGGPSVFVKKYRDLSKVEKLPKDSFLFLDHTTPIILRKYELSFDICVIPYPKNIHNIRDLSSLKLFEYMATGNPIVATQIPTNLEILDRKTAIIVDPDDPLSMANGLEKLINKKDLGATLARNAYLRVKNKYTWNIRARKILDKLKKIE